MKDPASAENRNRPVHRWVPWVAGFSSQFVADIIDRFVVKNSGFRPLVLDPFCGVGTTLVEALSLDVDSVGFEINPYAALATEVKTTAFSWDCVAREVAISDYRKWMCDFDAGVTPRDSSNRMGIKSKPPAGFRSPGFPFLARVSCHKCWRLWSSFRPLMTQMSGGCS